MTAIKLARLRLLIIEAPELTVEIFRGIQHGNRYAAPSPCVIA
jgi:hypothetical protein